MIKKPLKILTASAGSGKTHRLTGDFITLLFSGNNKYREILAVTFTNKATAEMKSRILSVLKALAKNESDADTQFFRAQILTAFPDKTEEELEQQAIYIYRQILHDYSRFSITTIDKFVLKVIRSLSHELNIDAGFQIELNTAKVTQELSQQLKESLNAHPDLLDWYIHIAKRKISNNESWDFTKALNQLANEIYSEDFQLFEMAFHQQQDPELLDSLVRNAEAQLKSALKEIEEHFNPLHELYQKNEEGISEFTSLRSNPLRFLKKPFEQKLLYAANKLAADNQISKLIERNGHIGKFFKKSDAAIESNIRFFEDSQPLLTALTEVYHASFTQMMSISVVLENLYYLKLVIELSRLLASYRAEHGVLLSSDATHLLNGIAKDHAENPSFIWEKVGNKYGHFLFDEFQDTSKKQWENFLPLLKNTLSQASGKRTENLVVGDVKQSIYRWRDGDWRLLLENVEKDLGHSFVEKDTLNDNYRSAGNIIRFNNMIFKNGPEWLQVKMNEKVETDAGLSFFESKWAAYQDIITKIYDPESTVQNIPEGRNNKGGIVEIKEFEVKSNAHRYSQVKEQVLQHTADTLYKWIVEEKTYKPGQVGILVKTNQRAKEIIQFVLQDLKNRNNPSAYQIISGDAFLLKENPVVRLLIHTLYLLSSSVRNQPIYLAHCIQEYRILKNSNDSSAGNSTLSAEEWLKIKHLNLISAGEYLPEKLCEENLQLAKYPLNELVEQLISIFEIGKNKDHLPYLLSFRSAIAQFNQDGAKGTDRFLEWWEEEQGNLTLPESDHADVIEVLTIHKSKGLAYDVVMLPSLDWSFGESRPNNNKWFDAQGTDFEMLGKLPVSFNKDLNETIFKFQYWEEELFNYIDALNELYVAMTRAKHHLFINLIGASSSSKTGISNYIVSDLIRETLSLYAIANSEEFNLNLDTERIKIQNVRTVDQNQWSFSYYPISNHLNLQLDKEEKDRMQRLSILKSKRMGSLAHEVLERISDVRDVEMEIDRMLAEGKFVIEERRELKEIVTGALNNKELHALLHADYQHLNEQTIIDTKGKNYRPDKVMIKGKEAVIIDFKFTTAKQKAHVVQIESYKELLFQMGFSSVRAFLFYGDPIDELKEI